MKAKILNLEEVIKCKCGILMKYNEFENHFQKCQEFKRTFRGFDESFSNLLKTYAEPKDNLLVIRFLLRQYLSIVSKKIQAHFIDIKKLCLEEPPPSNNEVNKININSININSKDNNVNVNINSNSANNTKRKYRSGSKKHKENKENKEGKEGKDCKDINKESKVSSKSRKNVRHKSKKEARSNSKKGSSKNINSASEKDNLRHSDYSRPFTMENKSHNNDDDDDDEYIQSTHTNKNTNITCFNCKKNSNLFYLECCHSICMSCFKEMAIKDIPNMTCELCKNEKKINPLISEKDKKALLGDKLYDTLYEKVNQELYGFIIECPNCKEKNSFEKGEVDYKIRDENGVILSKQAAEHYANNRCRCPNCKTIFCISCNSVPYHLGKTCNEFKEYCSSLKCRYDSTVITQNNKGPNLIICNNAECVKKYRNACKKILDCGHMCFGCKKENKCPPCLNKDCKGYKNLYDQNEDSFCNICYIEGIGNAPCVLLDCNHFIHYKCIEKRLKKAWVGPKITFGHCLCPACNKWISCSNVPNIQALVDQNKELYDKISAMALERLKFEGLDKDEKLINKNSRWYNKKLEYALNRISYYMCHKCKEPYFAGLRECGDGPLNNENNNKQYDPSDCLCGKCSKLFGVAGVTDCKIHGKEFIEYKCKFCCKIASWFCWGTTHFCDDCHTRQCNGDYVSKYTKDMLPKCDKKTCEVKIDHPPNGEEFALGCRVCRIEKGNMDDDS